MADRTVPETGQHEILAVGRLSKMPGSREAEMAVLVSDHYQRLRIGHRTGAVADSGGSRRKAREIVANILPENLAMRALANRFGFKIRASDDPTTVVAVLNLSDADATASHGA